MATDRRSDRSAARQEPGKRLNTSTAKPKMDGVGSGNVVVNRTAAQHGSRQERSAAVHADEMDFCGGPSETK
ncbi:MAG TPA: hypothetical protein VKZ50_04465 [bacterium]|nr:hypothetical protein [bacterium]